jgi:formylglycine-generating enzyme required for sulfatase activity
MFINIKHFIYLPVVLLIIVECSSRDTTTSIEYLNTNETMTRSSDEMIMVYVPGATFKLSEQGKGGKGNHSVKLNSFWIDQTEITNSHYEKCVAAGECLSPTTCAWGEPTYDVPSYSNHPVICVTWQMAKSYCEWAGARLPTEAEWDYAARGPKRFIYTWGDTFDSGFVNFCDANCPKADSQWQNANDGYARTSPVGSYLDGASWCGTLDMNGNVWEWIFDWYAPYSADYQENPTGPNIGNERVIRGGSWYDNPDFLRADHRHPFDPNDYNHLIGFRCVLPITDSE